MTWQLLPRCSFPHLLTLDWPFKLFWPVEHVWQEWQNASSRPGLQTPCILLLPWNLAEQLEQAEASVLDGEGANETELGLSSYELPWLKNWCFWTVVWRRLLRVPWTASRSNHSILKEISPAYSLEYECCWSWSSNTLATWCKELTHWKRHWCLEILKAEGEGDDRRLDG